MPKNTGNHECQSKGSGWWKNGKGKFSQQYNQEIRQIPAENANFENVTHSYPTSHRMNYDTNFNFHGTGIGRGLVKQGRGRSNYGQNPEQYSNHQHHQESLRRLADAENSHFQRANQSHPKSHQYNGAKLYENCENKGNLYKNIDVLTNTGTGTKPKSEMTFLSSDVQQRQDNQKDGFFYTPTPAPRNSITKTNNEDKTEAHEHSTGTNVQLGGDDEKLQTGGRNVGTNTNSAEKNYLIGNNFEQKDSLNFNGNQGAKKKKGKKAKVQNNSILLYLCNTCDKYFLEGCMSNHKFHSVTPLEEGYVDAAKKEFDILESTQQQIKNVLTNNQQIDGMLTLWDGIICDNLSEILQHLQTECSQRISDISTLAKDIENIRQQKQCTSFNELLAIQKSAKEAIKLADNHSSRAETIPFWLCFGFFKNALGLMLANGKAIYSIMPESGDFSLISLQGDRMLLSSFRNSLPTGKEAILLPYDVISKILERDSSLAFMKISYDKKDVGFVYIRVDKETTCGQQFLLLCMGEKGPSYLSNRFFRSCLKGKAGHHIWGGDYSKQNGSGGETVIGNRSNSMFLHPKPIVKGLLASRFGLQDKSTIFRVYLTGCEIPSSKSGLVCDSFGFGHVEEGLDALTYVADMNDITKAAIVDVGRVLYLG